MKKDTEYKRVLKQAFWKQFWQETIFLLFYALIILAIVFGGKNG